MNWMQCTGCKSTVIANPVGICLQCQTRSAKPQEDEWSVWKRSQSKSRVEKNLDYRHDKGIMYTTCTIDEWRGK